MVTRRSQSESSDVSSNEALREVLAEREAEVETLRQQLVELRTAGEDFLSDAAHAIRSPLTVTHSYLEILCSDLRDGLTEEQKSFLGIAYENAAKLRNLVDDLVDLAALETGAAQIELAPAQVSEIITSVQSEYGTIAEEKGLSLKTEVAEGLPAVTADKDRLQDVLRRLVDNAIRFTPEGGSISLRAKHDQDHVAIEVADIGVGIPSNRTNEAFDAFVQIHRKPGENRKGYGLGLPLCRRMVEAFDGTIALESTEGEGTTVTVKIPVSGSK